MTDNPSNKNNYGLRFNKNKIIDKRTGKYKIQKKYNGGKNINQGFDKKKLNEDPDTMKHKTVSVNFGQALMKARASAKITQKELAQKMNVKISIIKKYESAKAIPNPRIISNLERHLNCKLPRKK